MSSPVRAVLFDLGDTLVAGDEVLPGAREALETVGSATVDGRPVELGLVSDWTMAPAGASSSEVQALVEEYLALLGTFGLRSCFEPVDRRVTLSTEVGWRKPDRRIFERATGKLGVRLDEALFITESAAHVNAARVLGLRALRFGPGGEVEDWISGLAVVLDVLHPDGAGTPSERSMHDRMLRDNDLAAEPGDALRSGQTHESTPEGGMKRRRFSLH